MKKSTDKINIDRNLRSLFLPVLMVLLLLIGFQTKASSQEKTLDWSRLAKIKPELKVLVLIESERALSLEDLATLGELGLVPADRDPALLLGLRQAIFSTRLKRWMNRSPLPDHMKGKLLDRFIMSGIYRIGFRVGKEGYLGPLVLEVTTPRNSFGKRLLYSENIIRPQASNETHTDPAGNRWLRVDYPEVRHGQTIKLFLAFRYLVDMSALLDHDLMLVDQLQNAPIPEEIHPFLNSGYKIDARLLQAVAWAVQGKSGSPNVRLEYRRLTKFLKDTVTYDKKKRDHYFGGKAIYSDLDNMYQDIEVTLSRRLGACPDTTLLECAFLRAQGKPCRTAGRFGHFFSIVCTPGTGWMSTSVTPTGIPLFIAPGPDHIPYQKWKPGIPLKTLLLETQIRIEAAEE
ncbi:MAG: hypothetical protein A2156_06710 [Deltaproteobacteria bacterium RBG_16_48_10]|nr:MAG: hypothetical protein A2156_06710 [Deltaproteobacteria bacterium RBG_16_48_10]